MIKGEIFTLGDLLSQEAVGSRTQREIISLVEQVRVSLDCSKAMEAGVLGRSTFWGLHKNGKMILEICFIFYFWFLTHIQWCSVFELATLSSRGALGGGCRG